MAIVTKTRPLLPAQSPFVRSRIAQIRLHSQTAAKPKPLPALTVLEGSTGLKIALIYIYVSNGGMHDQYARRFARTYSQFPPGMAHATIVAVNGRQITNNIRTALAALPNVQFFPRSNDGWDIGAYQEIARKLKCDAMLCLGESVHFHRKDWLIPLANAWGKYGEGLYGPYASYQNKPHLNTTAFMCSPSLLHSYQDRIVTHGERYQFESTDNNVSFRAIRHGLPARMVTWDNTYEMGLWRSGKNILRDGDQSNCLMWCNHTDRYRDSDAHNKHILKATADSMSPVAVFYHARLLGGKPPVAEAHAINVMREQMRELAGSSLFYMAREVYIGLNGDERTLALAKEMLPKRDKVHWLLHGDAANDERKTLRALHNWATTHGGWSVCYFHLKGAMHEGNAVIDAWRNCMQRAIITNWWVSVKDLDSGYDMTGSHWLTSEHQPWIKTPFWGGNFWWAKADYINKLKPIADQPNVAPHDVQAAYAAGGYDVETWVGSGPNPKVRDYTAHWPGENCLK